MLRSLLSSSTLLLFLNVAAGLLYYAYQIVAARRLNPTALAELNVSMAYLGIVMTLGSVAQYWAVFRPQTASQTTKARTISLVCFAFTFVWMVAQPLFAYPVGALAVLAGAIPTATALQYWLGDLQRHRATLQFGLGGFFSSLTRILLAISAPLILPAAAATARGLSLAAVAGFLFALPILIFFSSRLPHEEQPSEPGSVGSHLLLATIVGFAFNLAPTYDLLNVRYWLGEETAGQYSRLQLFSRILFFTPVTLLQVTLPHYVRILRGDGSEASELHTIHKFELTGLAASYASAIFFGVSGPWIAEKILGISGMTSYEIAWICFSVPPIYWLLGSAQIAASARRPIVCTFLAAMPLLSMAIAPFIHWNETGNGLMAYLKYSTFANTLIGVIAYAVSIRILRQPKLRR